jgi:hypothetical protein
VRLLVIRDGVLLVLIGAATGVPLSLWPARALEALLFGVSRGTRGTLAGTGLLFALGASLADCSPPFGPQESIPSPLFARTEPARSLLPF